MNKPEPGRKVKAVTFAMKLVDENDTSKGLVMSGDYMFEYEDEDD